MPCTVPGAARTLTRAARPGRLAKLETGNGETRGRGARFNPYELSEGHGRRGVHQGPRERAGGTGRRSGGAEAFLTTGETGMNLSE